MATKKMNYAEKYLCRIEVRRGAQETLRKADAYPELVAALAAVLGEYEPIAPASVAVIAGHALLERLKG